MIPPPPLTPEATAEEEEDPIDILDGNDHGNGPVIEPVNSPGSRERPLAVDGDDNAEPQARRTERPDGSDHGPIAISGGIIPDGDTCGSVSDEVVRYLRDELGIRSIAALAVVVDHPEWDLAAVKAEVGRTAAGRCQSVAAVVASALTHGTFRPKSHLRPVGLMPGENETDRGRRRCRDLKAEMTSKRAGGLPQMLQEYGIPVTVAYAMSAYPEADPAKVRKNIGRVLDKAIACGDHDFVRFVAHCSLDGSPYPTAFPLLDWRDAYEDKWRVAKCQTQPWWRETDHVGWPLPEYDGLLTEKSNFVVGTDLDVSKAQESEARATGEETNSDARCGEIRTETEAGVDDGNGSALAGLPCRGS